ncbi:MAG TPA: ATP-binding protein [Pseudonocardia sp.]|jgi:anti-sigma regulatory factor (Ser/Thr protein kinase)
MSASFDEELRAEVRAPSLIRRRLRSWLTWQEWPTEEIEDLLLAVSEAVSNSVEHAYPPDEPGSVRVRAELQAEQQDRHRMVIVITDEGVWHDPSPEPVNRRRGIPMMRATTAGLEVDGTDEGTWVRMVSRPVSVPASARTTPLPVH